MIVLAGDIGGTNVRLALARVDAAGITLDEPVVVEGADYPRLSGAVDEFLRARGERPARACLGVAGTVAGQRVVGVNLPWPEIDAAELSRACAIERVCLINDFHAAARGVEHLGDDDSLVLNPGIAQPGAPIAILGAGTGLGQAFLVGPPGQRLVLATEGGHRDFAPRDAEQDRLLAFLRRKHGGRISTERALSGPGLLSIYEWVRSERGGDPAVDAVWGQAAAGKTISTRGLADAHPTSAAALALFVDVYGAEAGNLVLTLLARGGVWIAGGIAPDLLGHPAQAAAFRRAYLDKGRFQPLLADVPVRLVTNGALGLLGAAAEAVALG